MGVHIPEDAVIEASGHQNEATGGSFEDVKAVAELNTLDVDVLDEQCGCYTIEYECNDIHGNVGFAYQKVCVEDKTQPVIDVEMTQFEDQGVGHAVLNLFAKAKESQSGSFALVFCGALVGALVAKFSNKRHTSEFEQL